MRTPGLLLLLCVGFSVACRKTEQPPIAQPNKLTTISGTVVSNFTRVPQQGRRIYVNIQRPKDNEGLCLFCPQTFTETIDSAVTDAAGFFSLRTSSPADAISMVVYVEGGLWGKEIPNIGGTNAGVDFSTVQYVVLRTDLQISNNTRPPLTVDPSITAGFYVRARDTSFALYDYSLDTGVTVVTAYSITENGTIKGRQSEFVIRGFADTLRAHVELDPSTW